MSKFSIGVIADSFRLPIPEAVKAAKKVGADGIQVYAVQGDMAPEVMTGEKRRGFKALCDDQGLAISALCGDMGHGFGDRENNPLYVERSKRILDMAKELGTDIVTTHIGVIPSSPDHPRYKIMQDACGELAEYADSIGSHFAVETGPETALTLKGFLDGLHSTGVAVNLDPANFVMVTGDDPVAAVHTLKDYIVHTHAKDGKKLMDRDPEIIYGLRKDIIVTDESYIEVPLGTGSVPFDKYLSALDEIGYHGFLTIEREVGDDPAGDIQLAVNFLKERI